MQSRKQQMQDDEALARRLQQEENRRFEAERPAQEDDDAELAAAIALSLSLSPQEAETASLVSAAALQKAFDAEEAKQALSVRQTAAIAEAASLALAQKLQAEEDARDRPPVLLPYAGAYQAVQRTAVPQTLQLPIPTAAEIARLEPVIQQIAFIAAQEDDIHLHSRTLGAFCRENFVPMDVKYQLSFFGDIQAEFNRIRPAIEAIASAADKVAVQTVLNAIAAKPGVIEAETGMNMMSLLVKSWALVEKSGMEENKGFIIHNLNHNIEAQGGCDAGIAARLVQPYTTLLNLAMQNASGLYGNRRVSIRYQ